MNKITAGVILSVVAIALSLILYILGPAFISDGMFKGMIIGLSTFVLIVGLAVYLGIQIRGEQEGGLISFKKMFIEFFIMFAILTVASTIFEYVLYGLIDPNYMETAMEMTLENVYESTNGQMSDEDFAKMEERMKPQFDKSSLTATGIGLLGKLVWWTVVSVILAAILKKKAPEFEA